MFLNSMCEFMGFSFCLISSNFALLNHCFHSDLELFLGLLEVEYWCFLKNFHSLFQKVDILFICVVNKFFLNLWEINQYFLQSSLWELIQLHLT